MIFEDLSLNEFRYSEFFVRRNNPYTLHKEPGTMVQQSENITLIISAILYFSWDVENVSKNCFIIMISVLSRAYKHFFTKSKLQSQIYSWLLVPCFRQSQKCLQSHTVKIYLREKDQVLFMFIVALLIFVSSYSRDEFFTKVLYGGWQNGCLS